MDSFINKVEKSDVLDYLIKIPNLSINLIILDPPYFNVVNETWDTQWKNIDNYLLWMEKIIIQLERISKYSASCWVFGFPYQLIKIIPLFEKWGFTYKQMIVINKGIKSVAGRVSSKLKMFPTATEYVLYFHKEARPFIKTYLQNKLKDSKKTPKQVNVHLGKAINGGGTWSSIAGKKQKNIQYPTLEDWNKLETILGKHTIKYDDYVYKFNIQQGFTDVWDDINFYNDKKKYGKYHPTQKPYNLIERIIKSSSNENDVVLDCFMGSCMTAFVCKNLNRKYLGCEREQKYLDNNLISQKKNGSSTNETKSKSTETKSTESLKSTG